MTKLPYFLKTIVSDKDSGEIIDGLALRYDYIGALKSLSATVDFIQRIGGVVIDQTFESVVYIYGLKQFHTWIEEA